jgi:signal transduction histidine kinase
MRLNLRYSIYLSIIISLCTCGNAYAQRATIIDSLFIAVNSRSNNDTSKASLLVVIAHQYHNINADSEYFYAQKALILARSNKYPKAEVNALEAIGSSKFISGQLDSAAIYYYRALNICHAYQLRYEGCILLNNIANTLYRQSKYNAALEYYDSAIVCASKANNLAIVGKAKSNIGSIFYAMGNYSNALKSYIAGLQIQEKLGKPSAIASDLSNIANVYFRLFQFDKAVEYNTRGMELYKKAGNKTGTIGNLTTFAMIYDAEKKYDSALIRLNEALVLSKETKDAFTENIINANIAECYLKQDKYDRALPLYLQSVTVSEKLGDAEGAAIAKAGAGQTLLKQGKKADAIQYLTDALNTISQLGLKEQALVVTNALAQAYEQSGDYKQSLHYIKLNHSYRDSINRSKTSQEAQQLVFNYELQKKEAIIDLMKTNEDVLHAKDRIKNLLLFTVILGLCMAAIAAYLFMLNVRKLNKNREVLKQQKHEMELQAKKLQDMNDFKDNTFNVLSHDLRSPVNALTSAMMLLDEKIITPEEFAMHRHELNSKLQSVSLLLENMLYWARSQMKGEDILNISKLNVKNKALRVIAVLKDAAQQKNILLSYDAPEHLHVYADQNQLDIILRNLTSNAIKFTPPGGNVVIRAREDGRNTLISVTDSGVGMTTEQMNMLFKENSHASTQGTSGERGTGLGLQLSNKFAKNNGGSIHVVSKPGKGTTFTLILPNVAA